MLDQDLAALYGVKVKHLYRAVKRNRDRFPPDFMFQLARDEWNNLRSQSMTSTALRGGRRYPPYAFTEHGAVMAVTLLNSDRGDGTEPEEKHALDELGLMPRGSPSLSANRGCQSSSSANAPTRATTRAVVPPTMTSPRPPGSTS